MCLHHKQHRFQGIPELHELEKKMDRRDFLSRTAMGMGALALGSIFTQDGLLAKNLDPGGGLPGLPHHPPKAKRIIYLFQSGGPSQLDLYDYKPQLSKMHGQDLPASIRGEQRLTGMSANQSIFPVAQSAFNFNQYGQSRTWVSELMPHTAEVVDELCFIKSMITEQINHDPAITFMQTGHQLPGRPSMGAWMSYGLGSENQNLPGFVVLVSKNAVRDQPLYARLWGNGFLPSQHQGVQFRSGKDPVLYLSNPENYEGQDRKEMLDYLKELNGLQYDTYGDPEINARISQYEMAFRMQSSVPEVSDMSDEPGFGIRPVRAEGHLQAIGYGYLDVSRIWACSPKTHAKRMSNLSRKKHSYTRWITHGTVPEEFKNQWPKPIQPSVQALKSRS